MYHYLCIMDVLRLLLLLLITNLTSNHNRKHNPNPNPNLTPNHNPNRASEHDSPDCLDREGPYQGSTSTLPNGKVGLG